jgi:GNAT superfamily N-acetyltransferase
VIPDVIIRPAVLEDRSFIIDSWLKSYRRSPFARRIPDDVYLSPWGHAGFVEQMMLVTPWCPVACLPTDPSFIFGFAVFGLSGEVHRTKKLLHYLYVKKDYRKNGVGRLLLGKIDPDFPRTVTAETPAWKGFAAKHGIAYEYRHPYRKDR